MAIEAYAQRHAPKHAAQGSTELPGGGGGRLHVGTIGLLQQAHHPKHAKATKPPGACALSHTCN